MQSDLNPIWKPAAAGNYRKGRLNRISRITFHHIAGDAAGAISRFETPGIEVSATYVIGSDGTLYQCVDENDTPYTDGNSDSNSRSITIEHAGGHPSVPYTEAMYATSTGLVANLIARYGITDFKRHRDVIDTAVYPGGTACPGTLDVERIIKESKELNAMPQISDAELQDLRRWKAIGVGLEKERDEVLYPYISAVSTALGVPNSAVKDPALNAIAALKKTGSVPSSSQDATDAAKYRTIKEALK